MSHRSLLVVVLLYGLVLTVSDLDYNSVFVDEAFHITAGHELIRGAPCQSCPFITGSIWLHPIIAAVGDSLGGLRGARLMNTFLGLALALVIYATARMLLDRRLGLIAATIFVCAGQTLYLMKLATYDMTAAFFLGSSFMLIVASERARSPRRGGALLFAGAVLLFLAAITKYLLPAFVPVMGLYVLLRQGLRRTLLCFALPLALLAGAYFLVAVYPVRAELQATMEGSRLHSQVPFITLFDWTIRWIALALLLAVFGVFHQTRGRLALYMIVLSSPVVLVHLLTGAEQSVNKNVLYSLVFLAPAAALGVDHFGAIFAMNSDSRAVRTFFTAAVLVIVAVYGYKNLKWLERQYPDMGPVVEFFAESGRDGMTVASNGYDQVIYEYSLRDRFPRAKFVHLGSVAFSGASAPAREDKVDFVLCMDTYYGKAFPCSDYREYLGDDYVELENITLPLSWGSTEARILGRR